eukprot:TRINITY_DN5439_c0_g1_i17.p2 TRINITY_DN5439_c0_g1~~TRINITY_DN5439_c0_g1_i17.p2  ORF type:complete len:128 (+),score=21.71 TRINITY_DN5439_c0_g1_i17:279-662(+)
MHKVESMPSIARKMRTSLGNSWRLMFLNISGSSGKGISWKSAALPPVSNHAHVDAQARNRQELNQRHDLLSMSKGISQGQTKLGGNTGQAMHLNASIVSCFCLSDGASDGANFLRHPQQSNGLIWLL